MKPRWCTIVGYALAGMCFNHISMHHTSDMFHVCYEVTSVNTVELKSMMHDSDQRNMEKSVDRGSVVEQRVVGAAERSRLEKNKGKNSNIIAVPPTNGPCPHGLTACPLSPGWLPLSSRRVGSLQSIRVPAIEILFQIKIIVVLSQDPGSITRIDAICVLPGIVLFDSTPPGFHM